jgi:hypothetical protein
MAETVALKINVDAGNSVKTLGTLEEEIRDIGVEMLEVNKINIEFKNELKQLEAVYRKIPKSSLSARKKIKGDMDVLKEAITDNNLALQDFRLKKQEVNQMKKDLKKVSHHFERSMDSVLGFASALGETAAGFMLLTGASEESTHKIEKALGVMFAFEGMAKSVTSAMRVWNESIKGSAVATKLMAGAQALLNFVTSAGTTAMKFFRIALISTGIGALIVGVGLLIANFETIIGWVKKAYKSMSTMGKVILGVLMPPIGVLMLAFEGLMYVLEKLGIVESEEVKKSRKLRQDQRDEQKRLTKERIEFLERAIEKEIALRDKIIGAYDREIAIARSLGKVTEDIEREKLQAIIDSYKDEKILKDKAFKEEEDIHNKAIKANNEIWRQSKIAGQKRIDAEKEKWDKINAEHDEFAEKFKDVEADLEIFENNLSKDKEDREDEKAAARKERNKERKRLEEERLETEKQAIFDLQVAQKQADAEDILDEQKKAEALIEIERFKHEKELENIELTNAEKELLEFEYQQRIADISQGFVDAEFEREQAEKERLAEIKKEAEEKEKEAKKEKDAQDEIDKDKRIAREKEVQDAKFDLALGGIGALMQINDAFAGQTEAQQKKSFERNKKLQIAQALISASQGIVNILSASSLIPEPLATIYKAGQIGILAGVTAAQISKISQAQFSGGGSLNTPNISGGGNFGGGAPQLQPITNTSTLVPQEAQQVYVTETDISNTQNKVAVIEGQATIK